MKVGDPIEIYKRAGEVDQFVIERGKVVRVSEMSFSIKNKWSGMDENYLKGHCHWKVLDKIPFDLIHLWTPEEIVRWRSSQ